MEQATNWQRSVDGIDYCKGQKWQRTGYGKGREMAKVGTGKSQKRLDGYVNISKRWPKTSDPVFVLFCFVFACLFVLGGIAPKAKNTSESI